MKVVLVTASPEALSWIPKKLKEVTKVLNQVQNAQFTVETVGIYVQPKVVNGRITKEWFDTLSFPLHEKGYDFVIFHFSSAQKKEWGILPTLGGSSFRDDDFIGEGWLYADQNSKRKGHDRFIVTFLHEMSHLIANGTGVLDKTHEEDAKKGTVKALFKTYDMSLWMKAQKISWLQKQVAKLQSLMKPEPFFKGTYRITRGFGVYNPIYTQTKHHLGTDFATPLGTLVFAPYAGKLTQSVGKETGIVATLETAHGTYQFLHLGHCAPDGNYTKGHIIGYTGNTGTKTTGAHCCVRLWKSKPDISVLNENNFRQYLLDVNK